VNPVDSSQKTDSLPHAPIFTFLRSGAINSFQTSSADVSFIPNKGRHLGLAGSFNKLIPASRGRRFAFRVLQETQEVTMFSHTVFPPRSLGMT
jgi:hypothetical protein